MRLSGLKKFFSRDTDKNRRTGYRAGKTGTGAGTPGGKGTSAGIDR